MNPIADTGLPIPPSISRSLANDEYVLWHDAPQEPTIEKRELKTYGFVLAVLLGILAVGVCFVLSSMDLTPFLGCAGFIVVTLCYYVFVHPQVLVWDKRVTHYAVTNRRVLIANGLVFRRVQRIALATLQNVELQPLAEGYGSILLGETVKMTAHSGGRQMGRSLAQEREVGLPPPTLENIANAAQVYALIQEVRQEQQRMTNRRT